MKTIMKDQRQNNLNLNISYLFLTARSRGHLFDVDAISNISWYGFSNTQTYVYIPGLTWVNTHLKSKVVLWPKLTYGHLIDSLVYKYLIWSCTVVTNVQSKLVLFSNFNDVISWLVWSSKASWRDILIFPRLLVSGMKRKIVLYIELWLNDSRYSRCFW